MWWFLVKLFFILRIYFVIFKKKSLNFKNEKIIMWYNKIWIFDIRKKCVFIYFELELIFYIKNYILILEFKNNGVYIKYGYVKFVKIFIFM